MVWIVPVVDAVFECLDGLTLGDGPPQAGDHVLGLAREHRPLHDFKPTLDPLGFHSRDCADFDVFGKPRAWGMRLTADD